MVQPTPGLGWGGWFTQMECIQILDKVGKQVIIKHTMDLASVPLHEI